LVTAFGRDAGFSADNAASLHGPQTAQVRAGELRPWMTAMRRWLTRIDNIGTAKSARIFATGLDALAASET